MGWLLYWGCGGSYNMEEGQQDEQKIYVFL